MEKVDFELRDFLQDLTNIYGLPDVENKDLGGVVFSREKHNLPRTELNGNKVTVYLTEDCKHNSTQRTFQLGHEAVHVFFRSIDREKNSYN